MQADSPAFLVRHESRWRNCWEALAVVCARQFSSRGVLPANVPLHLVDSQAHLPTRAVFSSALLHFSILILLFRMPFGVLLADHHLPRRETVYELRKLTLSTYLPNLQPKGPGGRPGRGTRPDRLPVLGSTEFHPQLAVISNPPQPDNSTQTILQSSSPPDLRIPFELRLPNILLQSTMVAPKPPAQPAVRAVLQAPSKVENPIVAAAPALPSVPFTLDFPLPPLLTPEPHLPVPVPTAPASPEATVSAQHVGTPGIGGTDPAHGKGDLLILSINPVLPTDLLRLPPGNRYGAFSISNAGGHPGSPGGIPGGDPQGGAGGAGTGGDGSSGVGPSGYGGGGSGAIASLPVSILGPGGAPGGAVWGTLAAPSPAALVFPIPSTLHLRQNALLVASGPIGGGGLPVYGVLRGNKIYTKYLSMPGKSWILQYCLRGNPTPVAAGSMHQVVIQYDTGLVPPDAEEKFDFLRLPVPEDKKDAMFILQGVIRDDGSVAELKVLQGIQEEADQVALAAFGRWKFKSALREGQPVAVEILVGIPAVVP